VHAGGWRTWRRDLRRSVLPLRVALAVRSLPTGVWDESLAQAAEADKVAPPRKAAYALIVVLTWVIAAGIVALVVLRIAKA